MFEFKNFNYLSDGEIDLTLHEMAPANEEKGYVPAYLYYITRHNSLEIIGEIDIRIGDRDNENIYYGGNIGYGVDESYRGHNYGAKACNIIKLVGEGHGMDKLLITCNPDNLPSRKTCEKIGAKLLEIVDLPPHNEMFKEGARQKCIYEWTIVK